MVKKAKKRVKLLKIKSKSIKKAVKSVKRRKHKPEKRRSKQKQAKAVETMEMPSLFAVIRARGPVNVRRDIEDTLEILRLGRVNHCVLLPNVPSYKGMLHKAEGCITWGEINQQTLEKLIFKRGSLKADAKGKHEKVGKIEAAKISKKVMSDGLKDAGLKPVFRLNPPSKGYKSVRRFYPKGDLGYRGEKINELLKRMI